MKKAKLQLPDGRIAVFEVDDDATEQDVLKFAQDQFGSQKQQTQSPAQNLSSTHPARRPGEGFWAYTARDNNFGPDDSVIASTITHPQEAAKRFVSWLEDQIHIAAGLRPESWAYDNPAPFYGPSEQEQLEAGNKLAALIPTTGVVAAPRGPGILGTVLSPFTKNTAGGNHISKILKYDTTPTFNTAEIAQRLPFKNIEGVQPTAAMLNPEGGILKLEQAIRVAKPELFEGIGARDTSNIRAVYEALKAKALSDSDALKLMNKLNAQTGPMREKAFEIARQNPTMLPGGAQAPLQVELNAIRSTPGRRSVPETETLAKLADRFLEPAAGSDVQPEDLYALRKYLKDKLILRNNPFDEMSNAAKNQRREVMNLTDSIDHGINATSGGEFADYLKAYQEGIAPIQSGRAVDDVLLGMERNAPLPGTSLPTITPAGLRRGNLAETYINLGKTGLKDLLEPETRATMDDAIAVMNALEWAKNGPRGVNNSQTASYLSNLLGKALSSLGGLKGEVLLRALNAMGETRGSKLLTEAIMDPLSGNLESYLRTYGKNSLPPTKANTTLKGLLSRSAIETRGEYD